MWGTGNEHVRVMAFLGISKLLTLLHSSLLEYTIKVNKNAYCLYKGAITDVKLRMKN